METKILVDFQICISVPLSHSVLLACLKKYRSGNDFIKWAEILFKYQESCIINEGNTTKCVKLREGRIIVFKTLVISKKFFLSLILKVPTEVISELERIQKPLSPSKPKIKNETECTRR